MNLNKPIPFFINWNSNSKIAAFIRRHQWFFGGARPRAEAMSLYILLFIFAPVASSILYFDKKWATIIFILEMIHLWVYFFLYHAATSKPPYYTTKPLSHEEKTGNRRILAQESA